MRKFTVVATGKIDNFEFGVDGIRFKGKTIISYTHEKGRKEEKRKRGENAADFFNRLEMELSNRSHKW